MTSYRAKGERDILVLLREPIRIVYIDGVSIEMPQTLDWPELAERAANEIERLRAYVPKKISEEPEQ